MDIQHTQEACAIHSSLETKIYNSIMDFIVIILSVEIGIFKMLIYIRNKFALGITKKDFYFFYHQRSLEGDFSSC